MSHGPCAAFLLLWAVVIGLVAVAAIWSVPRGLRQASAQGTPREVTPRGALGPEEQAVIDLFEQARDLTRLTPWRTLASD